MIDKDLYAAICARENDLPLFHKDWWLDAVCPSWNTVVVRKGAFIAGVWPFSTEKKIGVTISRNPPLTPYLGPHVFFPKDLKESRRDNFEHETISELVKFLPPMKVWHTACRPGLKQVSLLEEHHFGLRFRQTFLMNLAESGEALFARLHEDFRRSIRKAATEMTITDEPASISMLYKFQQATLNRKEVKISYPQETLERLSEACARHGASALWVARKNGEVQAIMWNMWDDVRAYYLAGAKNPQVRDNHAMTALIWHAILHSKGLGKASFDFEGSMIPGVERFFRYFGGERVLYPVLKKNSSPVWRILKTIRP